jgi:tetratricopeptide (TPR) repeat protein
MKLLALFAVPLVLAVHSDIARQAPDPTTTASAQSSTAQTSDNAPMTERRREEMRAEILMARKDYREAALAYQRILDQDPKNPEILNRIGIAYQQLGQDDLAEHFYKNALRMDRKSAHALNNLGTIEYGKGRYGKAIKYYKKAVDTGGPDLAPVYSNLGYAYCGIKQFPRAMEAFGKALAIDPNVFDERGGAGSVAQQHSAVDQGTLHFMMAKSYAKVGDAEHAARYLKLARDDGYKDFMSVQKDPDFARVIKDPQVQDVLQRRPGYETGRDKPVTN